MDRKPVLTGVAAVVLTAAAVGFGLLVQTGAPVSVPPPVAETAPLIPTAQKAPVTYAPGVLPNRARTPGWPNPAVTESTISTTIAVHGWTARIRPPASYTNALKHKQLASGYAVNGDMNPADYEEDHLESLEDGGDPSDERNLWPGLWHVESNGCDLGMKTKDTVENAASAAVKAHRMTLLEAQYGLSHDWPQLYLKLVGPWPKWKGTPK